MRCWEVSSTFFNASLIASTIKSSSISLSSVNTLSSSATRRTTITGHGHFIHAGTRLTFHFHSCQFSLGLLNILLHLLSLLHHSAQSALHHFYILPSLLYWFNRFRYQIGTQLCLCLTHKTILRNRITCLLLLDLLALLFDNRRSCRLGFSQHDIQFHRFGKIIA